MRDEARWVAFKYSAPFSHSIRLVAHHQVQTRTAFNGCLKIKNKVNAYACESLGIIVSLMLMPYLSSIRLLTNSIYSAPSKVNQQRGKNNSKKNSFLSNFQKGPIKINAAFDWRLPPHCSLISAYCYQSCNMLTTFSSTD